MILAFDTSAAHCAAALLFAGEIIAERTEAMTKGQAERLFPMLAEILADSGKTWSDISALGVGIGPGNFTGIRLSVAAARGLGLSLGCPAVGVSSLEAQVEARPGRVLSLVDARRNQLYAQHFTDHDPGEPGLFDQTDLPAAYRDKVDICIGAMADTIAPLIGARAERPTRGIAASIARITSTRLDENPNPPRPKPLYLKQADAAPSKTRPALLLT